MKKAVGKVEPVKKLWLSKEEAMAYLGVSEDFLRDLRNNAKVSFAQDGRKIWYDLHSIDRYLLRHRVV
jgi:hypothetical protein